MESAAERDYAHLTESLAAHGVDVAAVEDRLRSHRVETPSWGYGNSGTRFKVFPQPDVPRDTFEKFEDAAQVHRLTGICPSVAIHIPWDRVDDYVELREHATSVGLQVGAVNPNLFQEEDYRLGSVCNADPAVRRKATEHLLECVEIGREVGSDALSLWLADGTNYAGEDSFVERRHRMHECLTEAYEAMPEGMRTLLEYKPFEQQGARGQGRLHHRRAVSGAPSRGPWRLRVHASWPATSTKKAPGRLQLACRSQASRRGLTSQTRARRPARVPPGDPGIRGG